MYPPLHKHQFESGALCGRTCRFNLPDTDEKGYTDFGQRPAEGWGRPYDKVRVSSYPVLPSTVGCGYERLLARPACTHVQEYIVVTELPTAALRPGDNMLAVEVHDSDHFNNDLKFDMILVALPGACRLPTPLCITTASRCG
jgi:hypothetical protein